MRALMVAAAVLLAAGPAAAQPAVEVRVKSVNDLLGYAEYLGGLAGQAEQAKQGAAFVKAMAGAKGIEGVDPAKPWGLYATVTPNVVDSPVVAMVPVADEEAFLNLLTGRLSLAPKKGDDGVYELHVPNVEPTVYFTFANGYAYATVRDKANLAKKGQADPKAFFPKDEPAVATVSVHIDRIPSEVRKTVFGQLELQLKQEKDKKNPGDTAASLKLKGILFDGFAAAGAGVLTDGKAMTAKLLVNPKEDDIALAVTLSAADGSDLAKSFKSVTARKGKAPAAGVAPNAVFSAAANVALPEALTAKLAPVIDDLLKDLVESAKEDDKQGTQKVLDAIGPTLKAGRLEAGLAMTGSMAGAYKLVGAFRATEGKGIENTAKEIAPFLPGDKFKAEFDTATAGGAALHALTVSNDGTKAIFGTEAVWAATADDLFVLSFEPDGAEAKRVAGGKEVGSEAVRVEVAVAAALKAFEKDLPEAKVQKFLAEAFEDASPVGKDGLRFTATGGEKLTLTLGAKGKAVRLLALIDQARKGK